MITQNLNRLLFLVKCPLLTDKRLLTDKSPLLTDKSPLFFLGSVAFALDVDREVVNYAVLESEAVLSAARSGHFRCFQTKKRKNPRRLATCTFFRRAHVRELASRFRMTCNNFLGFAGCCALSGGIQLGRRSRNPSRYRRLSLEDNDLCTFGKGEPLRLFVATCRRGRCGPGCLHKPRWLAFGLISFDATLEETLDAWM